MRKASTSEQAQFVQEYFEQKVRPHLVPILISDVGMPELKDGLVYLTIALEGDVSKRARVRPAGACLTTLTAFLVLPEKGGRRGLMFLDDVVAWDCPGSFATFQPDSVRAYAIKVTRDAEIDMDDDLSKSLLEKMKKGIAAASTATMSVFSLTGKCPKSC